MKRIAVVLAYNPRNAGMFSVDLAASHFFSNLGISVEFFCAQDPDAFGIRNSSHCEVAEPTVYYKIHKTNILHKHIRAANV